MSNPQNPANSAQNRPKTTQALKHLLADSYALMLKTQNYHWNVTGPEFNSLHTMFETHYQDLFEAVDLLAERIRALGELAPGSYTEFGKLATIKEGDNTFSAKEMTQDLIDSHDSLITSFNKAVKIAGEENDSVSEGIFIAREELHEKTRWMLQATMQGWG